MDDESGDEEHDAEDDEETVTQPLVLGVVGQLGRLQKQVSTTTRVNGCDGVT